MVMVGLKCRTKFLPVVLYECETFSVSPRSKYSREGQLMTNCQGEYLNVGEVN
jgi:hypothetical protein